MMSSTEEVINERHPAMPLPIGHVLGILADNLRLRGSVMPLSKRRATRWAHGLGLPIGGETVLYTGLMYQLMPSIHSLASRMAQMEDSWITRTMGLGRIVNKFINTSRLMAWPNRAEQDAFDRRLRNIAQLLRAAGVQFGYLYGKELYAGALVYDQGLDEVFKRHACKVAGVLRAHGVKRVITADPHTTNMLRSVYPVVVEEFGVEVKSYLEVLAEHAPQVSGSLSGDLVIHDSCVYARSEGVVEQPRTLLRKAGAQLAECGSSKALTECCGGPIESLFPNKAKAIAEKRIEQLKETGGGRVAAMCPICLLNLQNAAGGNGLAVKDVSEYLAEAYCPADNTVSAI